MDPNLFAGGRSEEHGCSSGTLEQDDDLWSFLLETQPSLAPLGMSSSPAPAVAEETNTNYPAASPAATHGAALFEEMSMPPSWDDGLLPMGKEHEVDQIMVSLLPLIAGDGLGKNNNNGGPAVSSHSSAVPVVEQATCTGELLHPQQQHPLPTNDLVVYLGGACGDNDASLINEQIQHVTAMTTTTTFPSQPPSYRSATHPMIVPGEADVNHAASSSLMGLQARTRVPSAPQDQDGDMLGWVQTQGRPNKLRPRRPGPTSRRGSRSTLTLDGIYEYLCDMGQSMFMQLAFHIREMLANEARTSIVWLHFSASQCKYCDAVTVTCKHCKTPMRPRSLTEMLVHMESQHPVELLLGSKRRALRITEITDENPNGESEQTNETDNSNATAGPMDTNADLPPLPRTQHQLPIDVDGSNSWLPSHEQLEPCCKGPNISPQLGFTKYFKQWKDDSWTELIILLSGSSCGLLTTNGTDEGFELNFKKEMVGSSEVVQVLSSQAWELVRENDPCKIGHHNEINLTTASTAANSSFLWVGVTNFYPVPLSGYHHAWYIMLHAFCSLGFRTSFAERLVNHIYRKVSNCRYTSILPHPSGGTMVENDRDNEDINNAEEGGSSRNSNRKERAPWSKVWGHFKRLSPSEAECNHCHSVFQAATTKGTSHLIRHIIRSCPEHAGSL